MSNEIPLINRPLTAEELSSFAKLSEKDFEILDAAILSCAETSWRKVAMIVARAKDKLESVYPQLSNIFYGEWIRMLFEQGRLESQGRLSYMRFSEVRLPAETASLELKLQPGRDWLTRHFRPRIFSTDSIAPVNRTNVDELFFIRMSAKPAPHNPEAAEFDGAQTVCWVSAATLREAEAIVVDGIEDEQWQPTKLDHWELVNRRFYVEKADYTETQRSEILEHVEAAFKYNLSFEFNCWEKGSSGLTDK